MRLHDHAGLARAAAIGPVIPALVIDVHEAARIRRSPRRAAFFCGAVASLAAQLESREARLFVRSAPRVAALLRLARETGARTVAWSAAYDAEGAESDRKLQAGLEEHGLRAVLVHDAPAVAPDETAAALSGVTAGYRSFAAYYASWSQATVTPSAERIQFGAAPQGEALPQPAQFDSRAPAVLDAREHAALRRLDGFLRGAALAYATARNVPALATSALSAHLSFGTIAARTVVARVRARAADPFLLAEERHSLEEFLRALARRDFFLQLAWFFERSSEEPLQARMRGFKFARTHPALDAWREGRTGYPLVDAGMRQLLATGTMHPRARSVAASFLCFDLGVDWRVGRDFWDRLLVEDDPALATGNWQWVAGVGADLAQTPRIFNPAKQARRLDPEGAYVRRWIPELADLPAAEVLEPSARMRRTQLSLPLFDRDAYPAPVVEHEIVARNFLARYADFIGRGAVAR